MTIEQSIEFFIGCVLLVAMFYFAWNIVKHGLDKFVTWWPHRTKHVHVYIELKESTRQQYLKEAKSRKITLSKLLSEKLERSGGSGKDARKSSNDMLMPDNGRRQNPASMYE